MSSRYSPSSWMVAAPPFVYFFLSMISGWNRSLAHTEAPSTSVFGSSAEILRIASLAPEISSRNGAMGLFHWTLPIPDIVGIL